jgi:thiol-disulfide isomerase/thioredoxin
MKKNALCFLTALLCSFHTMDAQKKFKLKIVLDSCIKIKNFEFKQNNAIELKTLDLKEKEGNLFVEGKYLSKYATIELYEKEGDRMSSMTRFWIDSESAVLRFKSCDKNKNPNSRKEYDLENVIRLNLFERNFYLFTKNEYSDLMNFSDSLQNKFNNGDSTALNSTENFKSLILKKQKVNEKELVYIKLHSKEYFSFWKFRELLPFMIGINIDSLTNTFNTFPDEFKNSYEGKKVLKSIFGKTQKVGSMALNFQTKDIKDKAIALSDYQGKYVILNFWATWCGPCIAEMPEIKKIKEKYPSSKLEIISISRDEDQSKILAFIKKNQMDWTQIVNDIELMNDFAVQAIPKNILIDDNGKIIYIIEGNDLDELKKLLKERLLK